MSVFSPTVGQWGYLNLHLEATEEGAEIILEKALQPQRKTRKMRKRKNTSRRQADKITPWVVFLLFFLDGTRDLVGTVQLQNTL